MIARVIEIFFLGDSYNRQECKKIEFIYHKIKLELTLLQSSTNYLFC